MLKNDTIPDLIFNLKPRLDALRFQTTRLKKENDNYTYYVLCVSLAISAIESMKLVLGLERNRIFVCVPILLSLVTGSLAAYIKKQDYASRTETLIKSSEECGHILEEIRNSNAVTPEIKEKYVRAISVIELATDPKSRGEYYKAAAKNLIQIQKASLKYKAALDMLEKGEIIDETDSEITEQDLIIPEPIINKDERLLLSPRTEPVATEITGVGADEDTNRKGEGGIRTPS